MTLQWTIVVGFLYCEVAVVSILLLPFISARRWQQFFRWRFVRSITNYSSVYSNIFIGLLGLLLIDAIRSVYRLTALKESSHNNADIHLDLHTHMKLFRAERNLFISGTALFLWFVIRRLTSMVTVLAQLTAANEASIKQAASATAMAEKLLSQIEDDKSDGKKGAVAVDTTPSESEFNKLKTDLKEMENELHTSKASLIALKSQAERTNEEYDRLMSEHAQLQEQTKPFGDSKKDS